MNQLKSVEHLNLNLIVFTGNRYEGQHLNGMKHGIGTLHYVIFIIYILKMVNLLKCLISIYRLTEINI